MKQNVCSTVERVVRLVLGLALLSLLFLLDGGARWWGLLGLVLIATALFRYCPLSHLFGIDTCTVRPPKHA